MRHARRTTEHGLPVEIRALRPRPSRRDTGARQAGPAFFCRNPYRGTPERLLIAKKTWQKRPINPPRAT